jgi:hypothetical protein
MEVIDLVIITTGVVLSVIGLGILPINPNKWGYEESYIEELVKSCGFKMLLIGFYTSCFGIFSGVLLIAYRMITLGNNK